MKILKVNILQRFAIIRIANEATAKGVDITRIKRVGSIGEKCEVTENELKKIDWRESPPCPTCKRKGETTLNPEKAKKLKVDIEFSLNEIDYIKEIINRKNEDKKFTVVDYCVAELSDQLGMKFEEDEKKEK